MKRTVGSKARKKGFEIYQNGLTHSTRCAIIGFHGEERLNCAKQPRLGERYIAAVYRDMKRP